MKKTVEKSQVDSRDIKHRLIVPIQTRGNLGKSTEAIARCDWMNERGIPWRGFDLDVSNRTLSTAFPGQVAFVRMSAEPEGQIIRILRGITRAKVTLIDPSAHMDQTILNAFRMIRFAEMAADVQARATVMVYPIDEVSDMDDIVDTVEALGNTVDWVVVRNPTRIPTTKFFERSPLEQLLGEYGAATLEIPALLTDTRNYLRTQEVRLGRSFSPSQALKDPALGLDVGHLLVLEDWLTRFFRQFDAIAPHLLPTDSLEAIPRSEPLRELAAPRKRGGAINLDADYE
jgi:hypothetical protein